MFGLFLLFLLVLLLLVTASHLVLFVSLFVLLLLVLLHLSLATSGGTGGSRALQRQVVSGGLVVLAAVLVQLALLDQSLLALGNRTQTPPSGISVSLHDDTLDLADHTVVNSGHHRRGHLSYAHRHRLSLGGDHNNLVSGLNAVGEAQQTRDHELGAVAHRVDGAVLDHHALERGEQDLQGHHDATQVSLVFALVVGVLRVQHVVHGAEVLLLGQNAGAHTAQLLHVTTRTGQQTQVHAQGTDVRTGLARHPEHAQVARGIILEHLGLVDGTDTQLTLDGGDQRRALEEGAGQGVHRLVQLAGVLQRSVQSHHTNVFLTSALLGLDQARGAVNAHNEAASHLGIKGATVTSLLHSHDALDPSDHFVTTRIGGLVQV
mmetsp:Transcript_57746/g.101452  ORF Transcript_57746/g.101452 Transcript_57746/m.101452 type:complete len:376 (+) Transcript_57746:317-1444(+)